MKMTPLTVLFGSLLVMFSWIIVIAILPVACVPSESDPERAPVYGAGAEGPRDLCQERLRLLPFSGHAPMDWGMGSGLATQPGDYAYDSPHEVGSSRNGPI